MCAIRTYKRFFCLFGALRCICNVRRLIFQDWRPNRLVRSPGYGSADVQRREVACVMRPQGGCVQNLKQRAAGSEHHTGIGGAVFQLHLVPVPEACAKLAGQWCWLPGLPGPTRALAAWPARLEPRGEPVARAVRGGRAVHAAPASSGWDPKWTQCNQLVC